MGDIMSGMWWNGRASGRGKRLVLYRTVPVQPMGHGSKSARGGCGMWRMIPLAPPQLARKSMDSVQAFVLVARLKADHTARPI